LVRRTPAATAGIAGGNRALEVSVFVRCEFFSALIPLEKRARLFPVNVASRVAGRRRRIALLFPTLGHGTFEVGTLGVGERFTALAALVELTGFVKVNRFLARLALERCKAGKKKAGEKNAFHNVMNSYPE
jgi:hypothetical protein